MIKLILSITILLSTSHFNGSWVLTSGSIDNPNPNQLVFERFDPKIHNSFQEVFTFNDKGNVLLNLHNPQELGFCGNGLLSIDSGSWSQKKGIIRLQIAGSRIAMSSWKMDREYSVKLADNQLTLNPIGKGTFQSVNPYLAPPNLD